MVPPPALVPRSRLRFALAVTLAALPVIAIDNLSATADTERATPGSAAVLITAAPRRSAPSTTVTTAGSTTTTAPAPTTTTPPTTEAPATTEATEAPVAPAPKVAASPTTAPPTTAPPTTVPPTTTTTAPPSTGAGDPDDPATWDQMAECESGGNWSLNTGNGYYGGLQFSLATWQNVGGAGYPHQATKAEQINRGKILQAQGGWGQWPYCAGQLGFL